MIPINKQPEPADFDSKVREPGKRYLASNPNPNFKGKYRYWKEAKNALYEAYGRVCAYSCFYLALATDSTVDHFLPKSHHPSLAYEWDNYRLAGARINSNKGESTKVIDPFIVQEGWFVLDFPSCLVRSGNGLSQILVDQIEKTIDELKLNDDDQFVQLRCDMMLSYADEEIMLPFLQKRYPFLALEIIRQKISPIDAQALFKRRT